MKDGNEIKRFIIEALELIPEDVESIELVVRLRGDVGTVKLNLVPPAPAAARPAK